MNLSRGISLKISDISYANLGGRFKSKASFSKSLLSSASVLEPLNLTNESVAWTLDIFVALNKLWVQIKHMFRPIGFGEIFLILYHLHDYPYISLEIPMKGYKSLFVTIDFPSWKAFSCPPRMNRLRDEGNLIVRFRPLRNLQALFDDARSESGLESWSSNAWGLSVCHLLLFQNLPYAYNTWQWHITADSFYYHIEVWSRF